MYGYMCLLYVCMYVWIKSSFELAQTGLAHVQMKNTTILNIWKAQSMYVFISIEDKKVVLFVCGEGFCTLLSGGCAFIRNEDSTHNFDLELPWALQLVRINNILAINKLVSISFMFSLYVWTFIKLSLVYPCHSNY